MYWAWWRVKVHSSWILTAAAAGALVGLVVSGLVVWDGFAVIGWLWLGIILLVIALTRGYRYLLPIVLVAGACIGVWRGNGVQEQLSAYASAYGTRVEIAGTVSDDPERNARGQTIVRLTSIMADEKKLPGMIWISSSTEGDVKRSDQLLVRGELGERFGPFVATIFDAELVHATRPEPGDVAGRVRDWFSGAVRTVIPEPEASLGMGFLTGQRRTLPVELDEALVIVGLTHIVVASGYNLTILVRLCRRLFARISKFVALASSAGLVLCFMAVTGVSPSMSRAGLVAGLALLAWSVGRTFHPVALLLMAAAATALIQPAYAWGDLGWLLSFTAFGGVMICAPLFQRYFFGEKQPGTIRQIIGETTAAFVVTAPILAYSFGYISSVALLANVLVLPLLPVAMLLTFFAGIVGSVLGSTFALIAFPAEALLKYMVGVAETLAEFPRAQLSLSPPLWVVIVVYVGIITLCWYMQRTTKLRLDGAAVIK